MEETAMKETKGNKEYKKLKKMLKKAYKASVKCNQLNAFIEDAKKDFPGYMEAKKAYEEAPYKADAVARANYTRAQADFYEIYADLLDKSSTIARKAYDLHLNVDEMLNYAGKTESEEE